MPGCRSDRADSDRLARRADRSELRTCHRDLFADNVLGTEAGGLCVIDWENCGLADPSQELGLVAFDFGAGDPDRRKTLRPGGRVPLGFP
jgi:thiamine kinase-like enzyme